jgi:hypothetical protein
LQHRHPHPRRRRPRRRRQQLRRRQRARSQRGCRRRAAPTGSGPSGSGRRRAGRPAGEDRYRERGGGRGEERECAEDMRGWQSTSSSTHSNGSSNAPAAGQRRYRPSQRAATARLGATAGSHEGDRQTDGRTHLGAAHLPDLRAPRVVVAIGSDSARPYALAASRPRAARAGGGGRRALPSRHRDARARLGGRSVCGVDGGGASVGEGGAARPVVAQGGDPLLAVCGVLGQQAQLPHAAARVLVLQQPR